MTTQSGPQPATMPPRPKRTTTAAPAAIEPPPGPAVIVAEPVLADLLDFGLLDSERPYQPTALTKYVDVPELTIEAAIRDRQFSGGTTGGGEVCGRYFVAWAKSNGHRLTDHGRRCILDGRARRRVAVGAAPPRALSPADSLAQQVADLQQRDQAALAEDRDTLERDWLMALSTPNARPEAIAEAAVPLGKTAADIADDLRLIAQVRELEKQVAAGQIDDVAEKIGAARTELLELPKRHREIERQARHRLMELEQKAHGGSGAREELRRLAASRPAWFLPGDPPTLRVAD